MKVRTAKFVVGIGALVGVTLGVAPAMASAATTCNAYPASVCTSPSSGNDGGKPLTSGASGTSGEVKTTSATTTTGELAFTGADIEQLVVIGVGCVAVGGVLLRRGRRQRSSTN
ncbi:MAG TPA: hypothetical protein VEJ87_10410 [Acidimicrobiales bacterium]|nr:hypothetical protein [Acidimicrobiales bacterium]